MQIPAYAEQESHFVLSTTTSVASASVFMTNVSPLVLLEKWLSPHVGRERTCSDLPLPFLCVVISYLIYRDGRFGKGAGCVVLLEGGGNTRGGRGFPKIYTPLREPSRFQSTREGESPIHKYFDGTIMSKS